MGDSEQLKLIVSAVDDATATLKKIQGELKDYSATAKRETTAVAAQTDRNSDTTRKALIGVGVALGATGIAMTAFAKSSVDAVKEQVTQTNRLAREIGATVEQTSQLIYAGKRMGLTADEASASFGILSKRITESREGAKDLALKHADLANKVEATQQKINATTQEIKKNGDATGELRTKVNGLTINLQQYQKELKETSDPLTKLGIATSTATGAARPFNDVLLDIADRFKDLENGPQKTALAMELFGRSGKELIPLLNQGSAGIKDLQAQADKLGLTLTAETVASVKQYTAAQRDMNDQVQALKLRIGVETLPVLTRFQEKLTGIVTAALSLPEPLQGIVTSILAFGGPVLTASGAVSGFAGNLGSAIPLMEKIGPSLRMPPQALVGVAILAALAAGFILVVNHFGGFSETMAAFNQFMEPAVEYLRIMWQMLVTGLSPAIENLRISWVQLMVAIEPFLPALRELAHITGVVLVVTIGLLIAALVGVVVIVVNILGWLARLEAAIINNIANGVRGAIAWVQSLIDFFRNINLAESGRRLWDTFIEGIKARAGAVKQSVTDVLDQVRRLLPFSDAKEGPLSQLTLSGRRLPETLAVGVAAGAGVLQSAVDGMLSNVALPTMNGGVNVGAATGSTTGAAAPTGQPATAAGGSVTHIHGNINLGDASAVDAFFRRIGRNQELAAAGLTTVGP